MSRQDPDRRTAYYTLLRITKDEAYANLELNNQIRRNRPGSPAFVRELVYTVIRNRMYLDYLLDQLVKRGFRRMPPEPLTLLRMGLAQILYMDSVPDHAAVNETVRLARVQCRYQAGMINGVLRNYLRDPEALRKPEDIQDETERLSVLYSFHRSIVELWIGQYGQEKAASMLAAGNTPAPLTVRLNTMRTTPEDLKKDLGREGITADVSPMSDRLLVLSGKDVLDTEAYRKGLYSPQGTGSILAVDALFPQPGETIIDVCAAPGGKTMAAAERMQGEGRIVAMDVYENKLGLIRAQAERSGLEIIETRANDAAAALPALVGKADKVICDVPCTGLGVIRRKPEIKLRAIEDEGRGLAEKQLAILEASSTYLRPGGDLLYSTCTVNRAENQRVTEAFLERHADYRMVEQRQLMPDGEEADGFYYCIIRKEN